MAEPKSKPEEGPIDEYARFMMSAKQMKIDHSGMSRRGRLPVSDRDEEISREMMSMDEVKTRYPESMEALIQYQERLQKEKGYQLQISRIESMGKIDDRTKGGIINQINQINEASVYEKLTYDKLRSTIDKLMFPRDPDPVEEKSAFKKRLEDFMKKGVAFVTSDSVGAPVNTSPPLQITEIIYKGHSFKIPVEWLTVLSKHSKEEEAKDIRRKQRPNDVDFDEWKSYVYGTLDIYGREIHTGRFTFFTTGCEEMKDELRTSAPFVSHKMFFIDEGELISEEEMNKRIMEERRKEIFDSLPSISEGAEAASPEV